MNEKKIYVQFRRDFETTYSGKPYAFFCAFDVSAGDYVVVSTQYGLSVGRVCNGEVPAGVTCNNDVVSVIDLKEYLRKQEVRKQLADLESEMARKYLEAEKMNLYRMLAENDPEFKKLIDQFDQLKNSL